MNTNPPLVSVVIPTYNRPNFLQRALESVLKQNYKQTEIIIVDDCPSDPVREIVESYTDDRIEYIQHEENKGVCAARNTGIKNITGKYVSFLDDDDRWNEKKLQQQVQLIGTADDIDIVYTGVRRVDNSGNTLSVARPKYRGDIGKQILLNNFVPFSSILVDQHTIQRTGDLDEYLTNWEDWEWNIRLAQESKFDFIKEPLVTTDRGEHHTRSDNFEQKRDIGFSRFIKKVQPIAAQYGTLFERKWKGHINYRLGYGALSNGYYSNARNQFWEAIRHWPFVLKFYPYFSIAMTGNQGYTAARCIKRWIKRKIN
jgi:glycosyltransferase involved in cell wall biosynthesis